MSSEELHMIKAVVNNATFDVHCDVCCCLGGLLGDRVSVQGCIEAICLGVKLCSVMLNISLWLESTSADSFPRLCSKKTKQGGAQGQFLGLR